MRLVERRTLSTAISRTICRLSSRIGLQYGSVLLTRADRCHVSLVVCDRELELGFCETIEKAQGDLVLASVKNHSLGFEVSYAAVGGERHIFLARRVAK